MFAARRFAIAAGTFLLMLSALTGVVSATPQLLVDMRSGEVLYEEDAGQPWHPASLTKLMTALVAFEAIDAGRVSLLTPVVVSQNALKQPPSKVGLPVDTALTLEDALYLLIVKSANDIAVAIAETVWGTESRFVGEMNLMAQEMGLTATRFVNPHGLDDPAQVSSARDLAVLALTIRARHPEYAQIFATGTVKLGKANLRTHNDLLGSFPGTTGMKTGYVCSSGLNIVATAERQNRALMAIVLGASSTRERGEKTAQLLTRGFSGSLSGTGESVLNIANKPGVEPVDMQPYICGKQAKAYAEEREAEFPLGLKGQHSYLTDKQATLTRAVSTLGRFREVALPRPRPLWAPAVNAIAEAGPGLSAQGDGEGPMAMSYVNGEAQAAEALPVPLPRPRLQR